MAAVGNEQLAALATLKSAFLAGHTPRPGDPVLQPAQGLAEVALLLALPCPADAEEANAQIEALQTASLRGYAAAHPHWAYPIMARVQAKLPDPAAVRDAQSKSTAWTPASWRTYVALLLG